MLTIGTCPAPQISLFCRMTLFLDTEFSGLEQSAFLISLGLVTAEGDWFYGELTDYEFAKLPDWHQTEVVPHLFLRRGIRQPDFTERPGTTVLGDRPTLVAALRDWLGRFEQVEIWADVLAYDWVFFCELFGGALQLPKHIYYIPFDFPTLLKVKGLDADVARESLVPGWMGLESGMRHNALYDAFLLREGYLRLNKSPSKTLNLRH